MRKIIGLVCLSLALTLTLTACQSFSPEKSLPNKTEKAHPLINKIWSVSEQQFISEDILNKRMLEPNVILLGETHDNIRHHQLQAQFIALLTTNKQSPAVAFEMLNQNQQGIINDFQNKYYSSIDTKSSQISTEVDNFAQIINWEKTGWPEWRYYRPVFYNTIENRLPIIAANLDIKTIRKVIRQGSQVLDKNYQDLLVKYQYEPALKKELEKEILASHCDMLPEKMLAPMLLGQQVRDLAMTQSILTSLSSQTKASKKAFQKTSLITSLKKSADKIILIAGSGHTRTDYGIPYYLQQERANLNTVSLSFMEVSEDEFNPEEYAKAWSDTAAQLPFDYVWFTEKAEREDQCEKMKAYMKKKKSK